MKKYIFLTGRYVPRPEATGLCVHKLAKDLASKGFDVETFCYGDSKDIFEVDGVCVARLKAPAYMLEKEKTPFNVFVSRVHKLFNIFNYPLRSKKMRNMFVYEVLKTIGEDDDIVLVASYTPFEAVSAMKIIKKKAKCHSIKCCYYCADTLSNEQTDAGILPASYREKKGKKQELSIFNDCDLIFIMECHKEHYLSDDFASVRDKIRIVNFPLLDKNLYSTEAKKADTVSITYTGTLYKTIRNPSYPLDCFLKFTNLNYKLSIVGGGDCDDIIAEKIALSNGKIEYLGKKPYTYARNAMIEADVLLSIGNDESPMMPSKIYEYISTGKPIIHFYNWDKDPCLPVLKKYHNAILIKNGECDIDILNKFIVERRILKYEEIAENFKSSKSEFTSEMIEKL